MTGTQDLLATLRHAREVTASAGRSADAPVVAAQEEAVKRLEACLKEGLPLLSAGDAGAVATELKQLLLDNRFQMRWSQIRYQLARIGAAKPLARPEVPRLDLIS